MKMDDKEIAIIKAIQEKLRQGDIKAIAETVGFSREYVGKCLNTTYDFYNQDIVDVALQVIQKREEHTAKVLEALTQ